MFDKERQNRMIPRHVAWFALLLAVALPLSAVRADNDQKKAKPGAKKDVREKADAKTLAEQIKAALKAGKITEKEAKAKLAALAGKSQSKKTVPAKGKPVKTGHKTLAEQIKAALKAGKITEKEAKAKLAALKVKSIPKKSKPTKGSPKDKKSSENEVLFQQIKVAVKEGRLTEADVKAKLEAILKTAKTTKSKPKKGVPNKSELKKGEPKKK